MVKIAFPRMCPRCKGAMIPETDWYGSYSTCLSCGYVHEAVSDPQPKEELLDEEDDRRRQRRRNPTHGKIRL